jgi:hypothetical protein
MLAVGLAKCPALAHLQIKEGREKKERKRTAG